MEELVYLDVTGLEGICDSWCFDEGEIYGKYTYQFQKRNQITSRLGALILVRLVLC
jgi:hypothetical protein